VFDARRAECDVIPRVGLLHADVMRDAQAEPVRLVLHGLHDVAIDVEDLDAVGAHPLELLDARARLLGRPRHRRPGELGIDEDARCGDLTARAPFAQLESLLRVAPHVPDGGDPGG
jgi:hypothetical protein